MLRDGDFKYSFWTHDIPELYNLRSDPDELNNLALDQKYSAKVEELKGKLFAWYTPPETERTN
jgi:choline-sulfatase